MTGHTLPLRDQLGVLAWLDRRRLSGRMSRPLAVGLLLGIPSLLAVGGLWSLGLATRPTLEGRAGGLTIAMLVAGGTSFLAYGVLFGAGDSRFLRLLGVSGTALLGERSGRLMAAALLLALALAIPYGAGDEGLWRPLLVGFATAIFSTGVAVMSFAAAARALATGGESVLGLGMRQWDPELARAAPLVYAPLIPFVLGTLLGGLGVGSEARMVVAALGVAAGFASVAIGMRIFAIAAARFLPQAGEMAYAPPTASSATAYGEFADRRGIALLLPRIAAAAWARDATVGGRRFPWAVRLSWPVAIVASVALARWGELDATRMWVVLTVGLALFAQGGAVVGLGILERRGPRWIDRAIAVPLWARFIGRSFWAAGLSAWLLVPVSLTWWWWSGTSNPWTWPMVGVCAALASTATSILTSGR